MSRYEFGIYSFADSISIEVFSRYSSVFFSNPAQTKPWFATTHVWQRLLDGLGDLDPLHGLGRPLRALERVRHGD